MYHRSIYKLVFICCFLTVHTISAQRKIEKTISGAHLTTLKIDARNCFGIIIKTHQLPKISIESSLEGEYKEDLVVSIIENENALIARSEFNPLFKNPNDKLSAHKVVSVFLKVFVPENFKVDLLGSTTKTKISGNYNSVKIVLENEDCFVKDFKGNADISTNTGSIFFEILNGQIETESKYGKVYQEKISGGLYKVSLKTVSGDIHVSKPK